MAAIFDYVAEINNKKGNNPRNDLEAFESVYNQFMVSRQFSYFIDTVFYANDLNLISSPLHGLSNLQHFDYLNNTVDKATRFSKWAKPIQQEHIEAIIQYYGYTHKKALEVVDLFTEDDIVKIKEKMFKGGV